MNRSEDQKPDARPTPESGQGLEKPSRRRLLRGGLAAAPAVLALKSTPVLACNCKTTSAWSNSGNVSQTGGHTSCSQPTWKPSVCRTKYSGSPSCYNSTTWQRADYCGQPPKNSKQNGCGLTTNGSYPSQTLDTCLGLGDTNMQALITTCYIEATRTGGNGFPSQATIKSLWSAYCTTGSYSPTVGVTWNSTQIKNYLLYLTGQL